MSGASHSFKARLNAASTTHPVAYDISSTDPAGLPLPSQLFFPRNQIEIVVPSKVPAAPVDKAVTVTLKRASAGYQVDYSVQLIKPIQVFKKEESPLQKELQKTGAIQKTP